MKKLEGVALALPVAAMAILLIGTLTSGGFTRTALAQGSSDEQVIWQAARTWSDVADAKDLDKTVSYYAEDASMYPSGAPVVTGKEQIRQVWSQFMAQPGYSLRTTTKSVDVAKSKDLAYEVGTFQMKMNDAQGAPAASVGKYIVVWKKQASGDWKAVADIFNLDK